MCVGRVKADLDRRVPESVIINLSGMQLLLLPDKLLHGYGGLAARQITLPHPQISTRCHLSILFPLTRRHTHGTSTKSVNFIAFLLYFCRCFLAVLMCLFSSLSLPETVSSEQQTKAPHNVSNAQSKSFATVCLC